MFMYYINYDNLPPACRFFRLHKSVLDYFHNITGHCWAFATVASVESLICIMTGNPFKKISVQHVIDCYPDYKKEDSTWGKPSLAFDYIINNNGGKMYWEVDYPSNHNNTQGPCAVQGKKPAVRIIRYEAVLGNERQLLEVVKRRPVIAGVVANSILKGGPKDRTIIRYKDVGGDDKLDHCELDMAVKMEWTSGFIKTFGVLIKEKMGIFELKGTFLMMTVGQPV